LSSPFGSSNPTDMNVPALCWWRVKCILITNGRPHIHVRSVIRTPENLIAFVDEKADEWIA